MAQYSPTALPQGANDGGDGSTMDKATWAVGSDKSAQSFIVKQGSTFIRCNLTNALDFDDTGYRVFDRPTGHRVKFVWKGTYRPQFQVFAHQYWEIQQEEAASLARRDHLPGEDLSQDAEEEFEVAGDRVFDSIEQPASTPLSASRGNFASSPPSGGRGRSSGSQSGSGRGSGGTRGHGSDGSGRGQGSHKSPMSPYSDKGNGPAGGSPGAGAAQDGNMS